MKPDPREPMEQPGPELGSVQQEARTCPVCGTKFFATGWGLSSGKGETLTQISKQHGVSAEEIQQLNKIEDAKKL